MRHLLKVTAITLLSGLLAGCEQPQGPIVREPTAPVSSTESDDRSAQQPAEGSTVASAEETRPVRLEDLASEEPGAAAQARREAGSGQGRAFTYTVKRGDTLWSLAKRFLGDGKRWPEIVDANPGLVPEKLAVGRQIVIPSP